MLIIKSKVVNYTKSNFEFWKQQIIKSSKFFFNYRKKCIQIFNANWLKIEKKNIRCENHDYNDFSNQTIFEFKNRDYNDFLNQKH